MESPDDSVKCLRGDHACIWRYIFASSLAVGVQVCARTRGEVVCAPLG